MRCPHIIPAISYFLFWLVKEVKRMTKDELLEENQTLRSTLQAIHDRIAVVLDIEDDQDLEGLEDDE